MIQQAQDAEGDGFTSLWYASGVGGDPLIATPMACRATTAIELGTAVLQTYPCHPVLMANRAASVVSAMGRPGFVLGIGPSHGPVIEGVYGYHDDRPGLHTEEYTQIVVKALRGEPVNVDGQLVSAHAAGRVT